MPTLGNHCNLPRVHLRFHTHEEPSRDGPGHLQAMAVSIRVLCKKASAHADDFACGLSQTILNFKKDSCRFPLFSQLVAHMVKGSSCAEP